MMWVSNYSKKPITSWGKFYSFFFWEDMADFDLFMIAFSITEAIGRLCVLFYFHSKESHSSVIKKVKEISKETYTVPETHTFTHTQKFHKHTKSEPIIYTRRTCGGGGLTKHYNIRTFNKVTEFVLGWPFTTRHGSCT